MNEPVPQIAPCWFCGEDLGDDAVPLEDLELHPFCAWKVVAHLIHSLGQFFSPEHSVQNIVQYYKPSTLEVARMTGVMGQPAQIASMQRTVDEFPLVDPIQVTVEMLAWLETKKVKNKNPAARFRNWMRKANGWRQPEIAGHVSDWDSVLT